MPIDAAAAKGLVLLSDESPEVRRTLLLALADRPEVLANDDVLPFLNDSDSQVRNTADMLLTGRGLSREQVSLATRATSPSPLTRAQAARQILQSTAMNRGVWLIHLSRDEAVPVRTEAVRALAAVGDQDCLARLVEMAESDPESKGRQLSRDLASQNPRAAPGSP